MRGRKVNVWIPDTISARAMQPCVSITLSPDVDADSTWVDTSSHSYHIIVNSKDIQQSMWFFQSLPLQNSIQGVNWWRRMKILGTCHKCERALQKHISFIFINFCYIYSKSLARAICVNERYKLYFLYIYSFFYIYSKSLARAICVNHTSNLSREPREYPCKFFFWPV